MLNHLLDLNFPNSNWGEPFEFINEQINFKRELPLGQE